MLTGYLSLDNINNVNHKYSYLYEPSKEIFVGKGVKKTHGYVSKVEKSALEIKRKEFWETRVEGNPDLCYLLKWSYLTEFWRIYWRYDLI